MTTMPTNISSLLFPPWGVRFPRFGRRLTAFAAGDNLFDRSIQAGKTPTLTLASPR